MSSETADTIAALGRVHLGRLAVSAADLSSAGGLLTINLGDLVPGAWVEIEAGATLRGIRIINSAGDDETAIFGDRVSWMLIVASPASPYTVTVTNEDAAVDPEHRLWIPSQSVPGMLMDGTIGQEAANAQWDPSLLSGVGRWRIPYAAP